MTKPLPKEEKWAYWRDKCDTLFSKLVKDRDGWRCVETGAKEKLQTAHIVSREYFNTRWDFDNAVCLYSGRHAWYTNHPIEWKRFINKLKGSRYYEKMEDKAMVAKKWGTEDLKELFNELQAVVFNS